MTTPFNRKPLVAVISALLLAGTTAGCVEEGTTNADSVEYTPEDRPLGVLAGEDTEGSPNATIILDGRFIGYPIPAGYTLEWEQIKGQDITPTNGWTNEDLEFVAPVVDGLETFEFKLKILDENGLQVADENGSLYEDNAKAIIFDQSLVQTFEAGEPGIEVLDADGNPIMLDGAAVLNVETELVGDISLVTETTGYSGEGYISDMVPSASVNMKIYVKETGNYSVWTGFRSQYDQKGYQITLDGLAIEGMFPLSGAFAEKRIGVYQLEQGYHDVEICCGWGYYEIDYLKLLPAAPPEPPKAVAPSLVNANATEQTQALMTVLTDNYGKKAFTGQQEAPWTVSEDLLKEANAIKSAVGELPAVMGFDLMNYSSSRIANGQTTDEYTEKVINAYNQGKMMLTMAWHWNAPMHLLDQGDGKDKDGNALSRDAKQHWDQGFYSSATTFDLAAALADTQSDEYKALISDIAIIAAELQKLEDEDIPVLWRPLHEAEGEWFWWGSAGSAAYVELWKLLYNELTITHGLDNLIWVFTAESTSSDWYPGDNYVDIIGVDGYHSASGLYDSEYKALKEIFDGKKLIALTEVGNTPDVQAQQDLDVWYSYFVTWNGFVQTENLEKAYKAEHALNSDDIDRIGGEQLAPPPVVIGGVTHSTYEGAWQLQVNWAATDGISLSNGWASSGTTALTGSKDLSQQAGANAVILQTYPTDGFDVTGIDKIKLSANAINAGPDTTAKLWAKDGSGTWRDAGATLITSGGIELSIDVADIDTVSGLGVQFEAFDGSATNALFFVDQVRFDDTLVEDFAAPLTHYAYDGSWEFQKNWSPTDGNTLSNGWSADGLLALTGSIDLTAAENSDATSLILQSYQGFDVTGVSTIKVTVNAANVGATATGKLWAKDADGAWRDAGASLIPNGGIELTLDVADIDTVSGMGIQFEGFDLTSAEAMVFIDKITFDDTLVESFEPSND
ncbi:glycosyl hydrolase (plasmid) [Catenovulum sp. SX2]|uniref:glycosyl hydrolase n=1 Tax=Catenovulum sp. SX2 TaxID=3398614 RepID=UPI003F850729